MDILKIWNFNFKHEKLNVHNYNIDLSAIIKETLINEISSGLIDIVIEDTLKAHDYMALINVIEGAGGKITDKYGKPITLQSDGSLIASSSHQLHNEIINIINN